MVGEARIRFGRGGGRGGPWAIRAIPENPIEFWWPGAFVYWDHDVTKTIFMGVAIGIDAYFAGGRFCLMLIDLCLLGYVDSTYPHVTSRYMFMFFQNASEFWNFFV